MPQVILDAVLRSRLPDLSQPLDLCDESGKVVARVIPVCDGPLYEPAEPPFSEDELRRSEQSGKWYTTAEVLAHLRSLEST